jgi:hypothetical protein
MITQIFTVYDSKAAAYMFPFQEQSVGAALRAFLDSLENEQHIFFKHSADFTLFHIGTFDNSTAKFDQFKTPISIGLGSELKLNKGQLS